MVLRFKTNFSTNGRRICFQSKGNDLKRLKTQTFRKNNFTEEAFYLFGNKIERAMCKIGPMREKFIRFYMS